MRLVRWAAAFALTAAASVTAAAGASAALPSADDRSRASRSEAQPEENRRYYEQLPYHVAKARARLLGTTHNDIGGRPDCASSTSQPCFNGVYGYLGYPTAWMMDRLQGDSYARGAFFSDGSGEIFHNDNWDSVAAANIDSAPSSAESKGR
jgi:hypothetical protein